MIIGVSTFTLRHLLINIYSNRILVPFNTICISIKPSLFIDRWRKIIRFIFSLSIRFFTVHRDKKEYLEYNISLTILQEILNNNCGAYLTPKKSYYYKNTALHKHYRVEIPSILIQGITQSKENQPWKPGSCL